MDTAYVGTVDKYIKGRKAKKTDVVVEETLLRVR
jgi:hypothetical protein